MLAFLCSCSQTLKKQCQNTDTGLMEDYLETDIRTYTNSCPLSLIVHLDQTDMKNNLQGL